MDYPVSKFPYIYEIEPTNHCPYKCIMCPRGRGQMQRKAGYMTLDDFAKAVSMFPKEQRVVRLHHFGEAILHPQIDEMIKMVNEKGLISVISLNPSTLNNNLSRKIVDASPSIVCFSLDAFTDKGLMSVRGIKKSYKQCIELMDSFIQMSLSSNKIAKPQPLTPSPQVRGNNNSRLSNTIVKVIQTVSLDTDSYESNEIRSKAVKLLKEKYTESDIVFYNAENTGFGNIELVEKTKKGGSDILIKNAKPCAAPFSEVSILWNGDVVLCCYDYDGFNVVGNIKHNTIEEIWNGGEIDKIREIFLERSTDRLKLCSKCFLAPHNFSKDTPFYEKNWGEEKVLIDLTAKALG